VRPNSKKAPSFIDSKPASENREGRRMTYAITWAEWVGHADASMRPLAAWERVTAKPSYVMITGA
jgi:hypothetical protein